MQWRFGAFYAGRTKELPRATPWVATELSNSSICPAWFSPLACADKASLGLVLCLLPSLHLPHFARLCHLIWAGSSSQAESPKSCLPKSQVVQELCLAGCKVCLASAPYSPDRAERLHLQWQLNVLLQLSFLGSCQGLLGKQREPVSSRKKMKLGCTTWEECLKNRPTSWDLCKTIKLQNLLQFYCALVSQKGDKVQAAKTNLEVTEAAENRVLEA